ncbi:2-dehydropantoate 2-reductase [Alkalibacterium putridalgicola]|uniref:2-dehydropantoate 2-reductase n=1 Tax=Alkalibacterium putridalgicola TaxID=426703 RepID=UPI0034CF5EA9
MKIAIAGSGALGSGFGFQMKKNGYEVTLLDYWDEHIAAVNKNGLTVTVNHQTERVNIPMMKPSEATDQFDLVFVFTKAMGLKQMLEDIGHTLSEDTIVVCLLNGLGHENTIEKYVPRENIIMGTTVWTASLNGPGQTTLYGDGPVEIQNIAPESKDKAEKVVAILNESHLNGHYSKDVQFTTWRKACVNGTMNALCALMDANINEIFSTSTHQSLLKGIVSEFAALAKVKGIHFDLEETLEYIYNVSRKLGSHYPSMHQDLSNKRPTEIDFLNGLVAEESRKVGLKAPYCQQITDLIHAKEDLLGVAR